LPGIGNDGSGEEVGREGGGQRWVAQRHDFRAMACMVLKTGRVSGKHEGRPVTASIDWYGPASLGQVDGGAAVDHVFGLETAYHRRFALSTVV
jgi:hypothetical protein